MRSLLFVPGDRPDRFGKAIAAGADAIILDLEDSVAPNAKASAREAVTAWLRDGSAERAGCRVFVRINPLALDWWEADLASAVHADGVMLPKAANGDDVARLDALLRVAEAEAGRTDGAVGILPIITETAAATLQTATYAGSSTRLVGLTWGAEDLSADIGAARKRDSQGSYTDVFRYARTQTLLAAVAAEVVPVDTVFPQIADAEGFERECREAAADGFTAKMAIHPSQVPVINRVFTPNEADVDRAKRIVGAFAAAGEPGVLQLDGEMLDRPHVRNAQALLARAARYS